MYVGVDQCVLEIVRVLPLLYTVVTLIIPKSLSLSFWGAFSGFSGFWGIRDAASITGQEDMETDRRAAEDLTTTGRTADYSLFS